jgi:hypothetical protein
LFSDEFARCAGNADTHYDDAWACVYMLHDLIRERVLEEAEVA